MAAEEGCDLSPRIRLDRETVRGEFARRLDMLSGSEVSACYQCGNCSSGCPLAEEMDILPSTVMHLAQLGQKDKLICSRTIWVCASCLQCTVRCPRGIDIQKVMDVLREMALAEGQDYFGPDDIRRMDVTEAPQPGIVSAYRKFST